MTSQPIDDNRASDPDVFAALLDLGRRAARAERRAAELVGERNKAIVDAVRGGSITQADAARAAGLTSGRVAQLMTEMRDSAASPR